MEGNEKVTAQTVESGEDRNVQVIIQEERVGSKLFLFLSFFFFSLFSALTFEQTQKL